MVLICNGPKITLRCGTCGTEIHHVGYDPGQPWPNAEALGWGVSQDPRGKPGWDHRCPECLAEIANQNEPMDAGEDRAPDQDNPHKLRSAAGSESDNHAVCSENLRALLMGRQLASYRHLSKESRERAVHRG